MTMVCSRVDCDERAAALLVYDPRGAMAWLRDRDPVGDRGQAIILCAAHADRASVPMGWTLTDERSPVYNATPTAPRIDLTTDPATVGADGTDEADGVDEVDPAADSDGPSADTDGTDGDPGEPDVEMAAVADISPADASGDDAGDDPNGTGGDDDAEVLTLWGDHPSDGDSGEPRSPLLARAFRAAHRP